MIHLESIINQLLFQHNYVVIPSLGVIKGDLVGSEVDEVSNAIKPPRKVLTFDQTVKDDKEELLLKSIVSNLDLPASSAQEQIKGYVNHVKSKLADVGEYTLEGVGEFSVDTNGEFVFAQLNEVNFLGDSFGMPELFYKPILRDKSMKQEQSNQQNAVKKLPLLKKNNVRTSQEVERKSNKAVYAIIPALILVCVLGFFLLHKKGYLDGKAVNANKGAADQVAAKILIPDSTSSKDLDEGFIADTLSKDDTQFYIITGVYSTEENAQVYIDTHDGCQIEQQGEYYRVFVEKYATKDDALNHLLDFKSVYGENLWVLEY